MNVYNDASTDRVVNDNVEVAVDRLATDVSGGEGQILCSGRQGAYWIGGVARRRYRAWSADFEQCKCFKDCLKTSKHNCFKETLIMISNPTFDELYLSWLEALSNINKD